MKVVLKTRYQELCKIASNICKYSAGRNEFLSENMPNNSLKVYGTQYKNGFPYFTVYIEGIWVTKSAKYFVPSNSKYKE